MDRQFLTTSSYILFNFSLSLTGGYKTQKTPEAHHHKKMRIAFGFSPVYFVLPSLKERT